MSAKCTKWRIYTSTFIKRERERKSQGFHFYKYHTLEYHDGGSSHWVEDLMYMRPPDYSDMFFIARN